MNMLFLADMFQYIGLFGDELHVLNQYLLFIYLFWQICSNTSNYLATNYMYSTDIRYLFICFGRFVPIHRSIWRRITCTQPIRVYSIFIYKLFYFVGICTPHQILQLVLLK